MDAQTVLKAKTAQLCQQIGAIEVQLLKLQTQKDSLIAQLDALDVLAPALKGPNKPGPALVAPKSDVKLD